MTKLQTKHEASKVKIKEIYNTGMDFSSDVSKVARQLAFGEGAIFWLFFKEADKLTPIITIGLSLLVLYFISDLFQYIIAAWLNKNLASFYENLNNKDSPIDPETIDRPHGMNNPIYACYYIKLVMLSFASLILISLFVCKFINKPDLNRLENPNISLTLAIKCTPKCTPSIL
jgi:hypothetical protein